MKELSSRNKELFDIMDEMIDKYRWIPDCLSMYEYDLSNKELDELKEKVITECNDYFSLNESTLLSRLYEF